VNDDHSRNADFCEILLMPQVTVCRQDDVESSVDSGSQQNSVSETQPALIVNRYGGATR